MKIAEGSTSFTTKLQQSKHAFGKNWQSLLQCQAQFLLQW